jgi:lantibiotic biosynthesis protein
MISYPGPFLLRTPLLPVAAAAAATPQELQRIYARPDVQEALLVASPELHRVTLAWLAGSPLAEREQQRLENTLTKYLLRMSLRSTPFGLFAGVSLGRLGEQTRLRLAAGPEYRRHARLDMDFLGELAATLGQQADLRLTLRYFPNNTLYRVGNRWRYVEHRTAGRIRTHHLVDVDASYYLERVLTAARGGQHLRELAALLVAEDLPLADCEAFVHELIDNQLLVSEADPVITGDDPLARLVQLAAASGAAGPLPGLAAAVRALNQPLQVPGSGYGAVLAQAQACAAEVDPSQLLQIDLLKPTIQATLRPEVLETLREAVELLANVSYEVEPQSLTQFREAFSARYEQAAVPLLVALDAELGLGYPVHEGRAATAAPLLDGVVLDPPAASPRQFSWSAWRQFLLERYVQARQEGSGVIRLEAAAVRPFLGAGLRGLPSSAFSVCTVLAASAAEVDAGRFQVLHQGTGGPSAANLLGRFAHLSPELTTALQQLLAREQATYPDAVLAEIVHINQARVGNVAMRPALRPYEIPIVTRPGVPDSHVIELADLSLAVQDGELVLWSARLQRRVIPRLSTAQNASHNVLPMFHFLCDLQVQGLKTTLSWQWGALEEAAFLPRVEYGAVILARARWRIAAAEAAPLAGLSGEALRGAVARLFAERGIPSRVALKELDNELQLDIDNELHLRVLQSMLSPGKPLLLEESVLSEQSAWVEGAEGVFAHELVVPWERAAPPRLPARAWPAAAAVPRTFALGSEWAYFKVYCGPKTADELLVEVIRPLVEELQAAAIIDQWFFIRYADPQPHLRLRFHGTGPFYAAVIARLHAALAPYVATGLVVSLQADTYQRELERYGPATMLASEAWFSHDSQAVISLLGLLDGDAAEPLRWQLALRGVDALLTDFQLGLPAKAALLEQLQRGFKREFNVGSARARKSLADLYRRERPHIGRIMAAEAAPGLLPLLAPLRRRSRDSRAVVASVLAHPAADGPILSDLLSSYVHMFLNRMFRSKARMQEMVVYDFLFQYYTSQLAQERKRALQPLAAL